MPIAKTALHSALVLALAIAAPAVVPGPAAAELVPSFSGVVKATQPAVVTVRIALPPSSARVVHVVPEESDPESENFFERFFGSDAPEGHTPEGPVPPGVMPPGQEPTPQGLGSGFIIDPSGVIVTNYHVVEDSDDITVELDDGTELKATLVGADDKTDIAVLRVNAGRKLPAVDWGDSDAVDVGDWAIAIGNPFGLGGSVSAGIISARGRNINSGPYDDYFQIDAPINRGNSGGPLFNQRGGVIGVNAAIFSPSGGSVGIGFAIPSNQAREIVAELLEYGYVQRGWIGISIQQITPEIAQALALPRTDGVLVASVNEAGPAQLAGIETGDIILDFAGTPIETMRDLTRAVADTAPGRYATIRVLREGLERELTVRAAPYPT
ncbi:MAG TPA: trypsin-like peptidase domain-containing protein [Paracoccaceae bacterium]|nr:trypsin-like peptidase domain-containing protein [Paracoccaceae bacterium]